MFDLDASLGCHTDSRDIGDRRVKRHQPRQLHMMELFVTEDYATF